MEGLVVGGSALVNVDDHGCFPSATEKSLEELGQLALSEGDVGALHPDHKEQRRRHRGAFSAFHGLETLPLGLVVAKGRDAFPQREQRSVDVAGLLQPLSKRLGPVASF